MIEKFTFHEALLGMTHLVGWADGEDQGSEIDVKVQMIITEGIAESSIDEFKEKQATMKNYDETFEHCVATLKELGDELKAKAVAWMWQIALVASSGSDGDLDYDFDTWKTDDKKVNSEEKEWVEKAMKRLNVSSEQLKSASVSLPDIKRI